MMPRNAAIRALLRTTTTTTTRNVAITRQALTTPSPLNAQPTAAPVIVSFFGNDSRLNSSSSSNSSRWFSSSSSSSTDADGTTKTEEEPAAAAAEETTTDNETENTEPSFEEQLETLQGQVKNFKDQLLRSLAEQENTRQIAKRDVSAAKNYAIKSFAKSLLEVSDNLHRALDAVPAEAMEKSDDLKTLYEGVKMTNDGLTKAFQSNGIQAYCQEPGDVFDPTKHEALMEYPDPSKEPGTVGQVIKVGFTLNDRVLRPAEVGVVKKP